LADETPAPASPPTSEARPKPAVAPRRAKKTAGSEGEASPKEPSTPPKEAAAKPVAPKPAKPRKAPSAPVAPPPVVQKPVIAAPSPKDFPPGALVVDASGLILGRASSLIAQRLLRGASIVVVHAENAVVTGSRERVLAFYVANRARGSKRSGPHYPRYPDRIFRRTVRGMLPHQKTRGQQAFDRLVVHIGCPEGVKPAAPDWLTDAKVRPALRPPMTLGEISRLLGARL